MRVIEIRATGCEGHAIVVSEYDWYGFLANIKGDLYEPHFGSDDRVFVTIGRGTLSSVETDPESWQFFVSAVKATLFDNLPEPLESWQNARTLKELGQQRMRRLWRAPDTR
ncbi:hypothetical protein [Streptosporangium subroseum]|nr:hypothetical protein [Streptosporangium subroseum]